MAKLPGLYKNIALKNARIKAGSGEKMRKAGAKGKVMSGKTHTASSKFLVHMSGLSATAKKVARKSA